MLNRLKIAIVTMLALALPTGMMVGTVAAQTTNLKDGVCAGANLDANALNPDGNVAACDSAGAGNTVNNIVRTVINVFTWVVGIVSVIMIIVGGFKYITSGGDSGAVTGAKNTILYAIVGLVVVVLAQVIVRFVLSNVSTVT